MRIKAPTLCPPGVDRYLNEFQFRWNRKAQNIFILVIAALVIGRALPYKQLIADLEQTTDNGTLRLTGSECPMTGCGRIGCGPRAMEASGSQALCLCSLVLHPSRRYQRRNKTAAVSPVS